MHFRLPTPLHGWREFAGEVGIIVLGVLIALGFGQIAEALHDRWNAAEARDAIRAEVRENLSWLEVRDDFRTGSSVRRDQPAPMSRQQRDELLESGHRLAVANRFGERHGLRPPNPEIHI